MTLGKERGLPSKSRNSHHYPSARLVSSWVDSNSRPCQCEMLRYVIMTICIKLNQFKLVHQTGLAKQETDPTLQCCHLESNHSHLWEMFKVAN